jgi:hypothetical protein
MFSIESFDFLFISQYMFFSLSSSWRLLAFMWFSQQMQIEILHLHFNRNCDVINVYLGTEGFSCCECYLSRFDRVYLDFPFFSQFCERLRRCSLSEAVAGFAPEDNMAVLSGMLLLVY